MINVNVDEFVPSTARWTNSTHLILALHCVVRRYKTQKIAAKELGISPQHLNDLLSGKREPTDRIANQFGLKRQVIYVKIDD